MTTFHNGIRRACTVLLGLVFFGAGILKLMDPVGAQLVMDEYFKFFHTGWLEFASKPAGVAMALLETLTGAALLAGVWRKYVALVTAVLVAGFTILTLILVIFNPEMDCGCFGEAIPMTHLQTFLKNIVLCCLCAGAFLPPKEFAPTRKAKVVAFGIVAATVVAFSAYSLIALPAVDFSEFAPGACLNDEEFTEETVAPEYLVVYSKDGVEETFTLENLPDSTWSFVRVEDTVVPGASGDAPSMFISDASGEYRNELLRQGRLMVLTINDPRKYHKLESAQEFISNAHEAGFGTLVIAREYIPELNSYQSDYKKIITLNRSNGGVTYISDGEIIRKWSASFLPGKEELEKLAKEDPSDVMVNRISGGRILFEGLTVASIAILLLL